MDLGLTLRNGRVAQIQSPKTLLRENAFNGLLGVGLCSLGWRRVPHSNKTTS
jgi:hypothetical protein